MKKIITEFYQLLKIQFVFYVVQHPKKQNSDQDRVKQQLYHSSIRKILHDKGISSFHYLKFISHFIYLNF